jgi:multiple sugar transport system ATP-binding protein
MIYVTHDQIEALTLADRIAVMKGGVIQQLADPADHLQPPVNRFVAGFIGSPSMNFLLTPGRKVVLGVRPEHIHVDNHQAGAEMHDAVVDIEEPMGADNLLWLKHAGHTMSVRTGGAKRFAPGTKLQMSFDMSVASLFDAETEERI